MIKRSVLSGLMVVLALGLATARVAEAQDITGDWQFSASIPMTCSWEGVLQFLQTGTTIDSAGNLVLTGGTNPPCPPALPGFTTGTITGLAVSFGASAPPPVGLVTFDGTVAVDGQTMSGTWTAPAVALTGTWSATRVPVTMPTLPEWGAVLMLALLLGAGVYALRRRQQRLPL
jgi:hypothetical protein